MGYPCFRFDLPGTCDSAVTQPAELMNFIDAWKRPSGTVEIIKQIRLRYNLESVIIIGHCSGAVTALFAASCQRRLPRIGSAGTVLPPVPPVRDEARAGPQRIGLPVTGWVAF